MTTPTRNKGRVTLAELFPAIGALIAASIAAGVMRLIPEELIPQNLRTPRIAAGLLVFVAVVLTWALQRKISRSTLVVIGALTLMSLIGWIALHQSFAVEAFIGTEGVGRTYLVGAEVSAEGVTAATRCPQQSAGELIECAGPDLIPLLWGRSFTVVAIVYFVCMTTSVLGIGALLTAAVIHDRLST